MLLKPTFQLSDTEPQKAAAEETVDNSCLDGLEQFINETVKEFQVDNFDTDSAVAEALNLDTPTAEGAIDVLNKSMQSLFSQEKDEPEKISQAVGEVKVNRNVTQSPDSATKATDVAASAVSDDADQLLSLNISAIDRTASKPSASQKARKCRRRIGESVSGNIRGDNHASKPTLPPTSTPLRKASELRRSPKIPLQPLPLANRTGSVLNCVNESKDSGFPLENISNDQKLDTSILLQPISHKELSDHSTLSSRSASVSTLSQTQIGRASCRERV